MLLVEILIIKANLFLIPVEVLEFSTGITEESDLLETMLNKQDTPQTVTIDFQQSESTASMKKIELKEAFITQFSESFSDGSPMVYQVTLSAKEMKIGKAELKNDWPKAKN